MVNNEWDVSDIFENDNKLKIDTEKYTKKMISFYDKYSCIKVFDADEILSALKLYEDITEFLFKIRLYMSVLYYDVNNNISWEVEQIVDRFCDSYKTNMEFFPISISEHEEIKKISKDMHFKNYKGYIDNIYNEKKYFLDSNSEKILKLKETTGYYALQQIYLEIFENAGFSFKKYGIVSYNQLLGLLNCEDYKIRKIASKKLGQFLHDNERIFTSLFNYATQDLYLDKELRSYSSIYDAIYRENEFSENDLNIMINEVMSNCNIFQNFYLIRAERESVNYIEGINFTSNYENRIEFEDAIELIMKAVGKISQSYCTMVSELLISNHIDYECKDGKQSGSICFASTPQIMPYIFINFSGTISDLFTLAHEIGHALHFMKLSCNSFINYVPVNLYAEIVAVFFETLVGIEYINEKKCDDALLEVSDNFFGKLFRQALNAIFEIRIREKKGYAKKEEIEKIWRELRQKFYGNTVKFYPYEKNNYWSIPHFICEPLLTAIYSFSQVISINLILLKDKDDFSRKFNDFMCLSSYQSFSEYLYNNFDISFSNKGMWEKAFSYLENLLKSEENIY